MDAFISHSSKNRAVAQRLARGLKACGVTVWLDKSGIQGGALLAKELQRAIGASRALILLWSAPAATSRWVNTEWLSAFHQNRFIAPCVLDDTPLPAWLQSAVSLDVSRVNAALAERLAHVVRTAPSRANQVAQVMRSESPKLGQVIEAIANGQKAVADLLMRRNLARAAEIQTNLDEVMKMSAAWRLDPLISTLDGYHIKNAYLLKHWDAILAGRAPQDALLAQAERRFFDTLSVDPTDASALNGLGSILIFRHDLDAAEFFIQAAVSTAQTRGMAYSAAEQDLALVQAYKKRR